jgi:erythromycin esterase-like protein
MTDRIDHIDHFVNDRTGLLAIGEPTHGEPAFPRWRNRFFADLVERHGFRSIALETDRVAAQLADDFVRGADVSLDRVLAEAFTHGFGGQAANRDLLAWMREHNAGRPAADRLSFHGFDAPVDIDHVASPLSYLERLADCLGAPRPVSGDDSRWTDPAALMDATRSIGRSPEAVALRAVADDLATALYAQAPRLIAETSPAAWRRAEADAAAALGLLRYHAAAADPAEPGARMSAMLSVRDAVMARNLLDLRAAEAGRGPTLVFAQNLHLQRNLSRMTLGSTRAQWWGAGSILAALLGDAYRVIVGGLGASPVMDIPAPPAASIEGMLRPGLTPAGEVVRGPVRPVDFRHFALDPETLDHADAVLHVPTGLDPAVLAERIAARADVAVVTSAEGDLFFHVGADRRRPFATIVVHDYPGWDECSQLDRPGAWRLNVDLGRREFERRFGFPPKDLPAHHGEFDFARGDVLLPHPSYGTAGWGSVVTPSPARLDEVDRLLAHAYERGCGVRHVRNE